MRASGEILNLNTEFEIDQSTEPGQNATILAAKTNNFRFQQDNG